jgi:hypothetical protein
VVVEPPGPGGPPFVITKIVAKFFVAPTRLMIRMKNVVGARSGNVIRRNFVHPLAPSTSAAS